MGAFEYTALDAQGRERKGLIEGDTPKHVRQLLREKHLLPMDIQETAGYRRVVSGEHPMRTMSGSRKSVIRIGMKIRATSRKSVDQC